jgi:GTPase
MNDMKHYSGFVNIIGKPNVGKSTLVNALLNDRLSIINSKAQTTRHRILGIYNEPQYQIVFSDTPGVIVPKYKLQESMMEFINQALEDADIFLYVINPSDSPDKEPEIFKKIIESGIKTIFVINKSDRFSENYTLNDLLPKWTDYFNENNYLLVSAKEKTGIQELLERIKSELPEGPAYYDKEDFTDRSERFFVSEIIREKILEVYSKEIPYSCEVVVEEFKDTDELLRIRAEIFVNRKSQKSIVIGKGGDKINKVGTEARKDIESFFGKKVFLDLYVKVKENWRDDDRLLKYWGYKSE